MSLTSSQARAKTLLSLFNFSKTLALTQHLHAQIITHGLHCSVLFGSNLANAYIQFDFLQFASKSFHQIKNKNLHSWNTIISGYSRQKRWLDVLSLYKQMRIDTNGVDSFNLVFAIKASVGLGILRDGEFMHSLVIKSGFEEDPFVVPALLDMYVELGCLDDAQKVFAVFPEWNLVVWGAMMKGYLKFSKEFKVFELFSHMIGSGFELDAFTSESVIRACGNVFAGREGKACHGFCIKRNFINSSMCLQTSIVNTYIKCGLFHLAVKLFEEIPNKDVVLWTAMVTGYAKNGRGWEAIDMFRRMLDESMVPNSVTLASVILACSQMGSLRQGKSAHGYMLKHGVEMDVVNYTSFIDMYAKCGCIAVAERVFNQIPDKNVFSWSAMINGFGMHGLYSDAIATFDQMTSENQVPNSVTFVSVLSACSHSGRVEEGWIYFRSMSGEYGIAPKREHFACMVDLLGRAGKIDEALSVISSMPMDAGTSTWGALLSACRIHKWVELAEVVAKKLLPLEADKSAVYVLLSNIYADAGMWDMVKKIRFEVCEKGLHKSAGFSSVEVDKKLHVFHSKDKLPYRNLQIEGVWASLCKQMTEGNVADQFL